MIIPRDGMPFLEILDRLHLGEVVFLAVVGVLVTLHLVGEEIVLFLARFSPDAGHVTGATAREKPLQSVEEILCEHGADGVIFGDAVRRYVKGYDC